MHRAVYEKFKTIFPGLNKHIIRWAPYGNHRVKLYVDYGPVLVFTYKNQSEWRIETIKSNASNT